MRRRQGLALTVALLALATGCGELRDLWTLRDTIEDRFESCAVHVSVEGGRRTLTVTISREDLLSLAPETQAELAYAVARFTHAHYARATRVDDYEVVLEQEKESRLWFPLTWKISFHFAPSELDSA